MQTRPLGRSGPRVSALGFGCMGLVGWYGARDDAESRATLTAALDRGITHFDTASSYQLGESERFVGPVLRAARAVITDDEATVALLERYLRVAPARVRVIPLGVDAPDPLPEPAVFERPYLFYAGNHRPHKDLATLVAAWGSLPG